MELLLLLLLLLTTAKIGVKTEASAQAAAVAAPELATSRACYLHPRSALGISVAKQKILEDVDFKLRED